jgi:transposase-like protein
MQKYTKEEKQNAIARYAVGNESVSDILADMGIPKSTFYGWLEAWSSVKLTDSLFEGKLCPA